MGERILRVTAYAALALVITVSSCRSVTRAETPVAAPPAAEARP